MRALNEILTPGRTACNVQGISKKRLFETIAGIVSDDYPGLPQHEVLDQLNARERLGSTGMGEGIAIPHCRVANCASPIGALLTLEEAIDYDAPDERPVDLLFVLLVPEEAHQEHLDILAEVARLFSQHDFCKRLRGTTDDRTLYDLACAGDG
ncbi:MAG: PTS IIA-like nitrogen regulatory protein PtsN [Halioglobus sp.]